MTPKINKINIDNTEYELQTTIANVENLQTSLDAKVPTSLTINDKALTSNITLTASDVDAYSKDEIDNFEFITVDDIDTICSTTIQVATASEVTF